MSLVLAFLLALQAADLDGLRHPDLEERTRAAFRLRGRADALPLLFQGLRDSDPEVRGRVADVLRFSSPLHWSGQADLLESLLLSPAPADAVERSHRFLRSELRSPRPISDLRASAPLYGQSLLLTGELRAAAFDPVLAAGIQVSLVRGREQPKDVTFLPSEGVIWAGYRRDLPKAPKLLPWLLKHLDEPDAILVLAQMLRHEQVRALIDDPRPEALELLLTAHALQRCESLHPGLLARIPERLQTAGPRGAAALSLVLRNHAKELAAVLNAGAAGPSRWGRYLSVATAASNPMKDLDAETFHRLLQDHEPRIREQAVRAVISRFPSEAWDCRALLQAVEGMPERSAHLHLLRMTRDPLMQAAAVDSLLLTPEASLAVLEDCADPEILDAAVLALGRHPDRSFFARSTSALRRATEVADDAEARAYLRTHFNGRDDDAGARAAYALGGLPAREILGLLEPTLESPLLATRRRAFLAIRRLGSLAEPGSCLLEHLRGLLRARAEVEKDLWFGGELQELVETPAWVAHGPHEVWSFRSSSRCGTRRASEQGGWLALPSAAVPLPDWVD